ncbi:MAG: hypothetical protein HQK53_18325 [Oligoflexia bacterium]|nr:hypothetical protein [Oligoflexia bacterium]
MIAKIDADLAAKAAAGQALRDFKPEAGVTSWQNPLSFYTRAKSEATKVMKVEVELKILSELSTEDANRPTKAMIAAEKAGKGKYTKMNRIYYDLYLNDAGEILEGDMTGGDLDFLWFAAGKGAQEHRQEGDPHLRYDVVNELATEASNATVTAPATTHP